MGFFFKYWFYYLLGLGIEVPTEQADPIKCQQPPAYEYSIGEC